VGHPGPLARFRPERQPRAPGAALTPVRRPDATEDHDGFAVNFPEWAAIGHKG